MDKAVKVLLVPIKLSFICSAGVIPLLTILLVVNMIADPLQSKPVHL